MNKLYIDEKTVYNDIVKQLDTLTEHEHIQLISIVAQGKDFFDHSYAKKVLEELKRREIRFTLESRAFLNKSEQAYSWSTNRVKQLVDNGLQRVFIEFNLHDTDARIDEMKAKTLARIQEAGGIAIPIFYVGKEYTLGKINALVKFCRANGSNAIELYNKEKDRKLGKLHKFILTLVCKWHNRKGIIIKNFCK